MELPAQTVSNDVIYLPSEGTAAFQGRSEHRLGVEECKYGSEGADGKLPVSKNWKA